MSLDGRLLALPERPRVQLEQSPLLAVICQVRFVAMCPIEDPVTIAPFREALFRHFPLVQVQPQNLQVQVDATGVRQQMGVQWRFSDEADNWQLILAADALTLEARRYHLFTELVEHMEAGLDALTANLAPGPIMRLGLRYINEIRGVDLLWDEIIHPDLLGPLRDPVLGPEIVQSYNQIQLRVGGSLRLHLQYGWFPQGSLVRPAQGESPKVGMPFYLLDIDASETFTGRDESVLAPREIADRLGMYHRNSYRLFRWAVTDTYIQEMAEKA